MSKIVLCVDDSVTMQMVADITFRGTEFTYVGARSYDEAMEKIKGGKPSLVLADAAMPGKSGYDLCQSLKADPKYADVPCVVLVGNSSPYDAAKGSAVGVDANITKPWDTANMLTTCQNIVATGVVAKPAAAAAPAQAPRAATAPAAAPAAASAARAGTAPAAGSAAAAAAAAAANRSATIMGMPSIKVPGGVAPAVAPAPAPAPVAAAAAAAPAPAKTTMMATPSMPATGMVAPASAGAARAPMVAGAATKRSALVERTLAKMAAKLAEATGLAPGSPELLALLKLSTEVVERVVWEVVPELAEQIIRENLNTLAAKRA